MTSILLPKVLEAAETYGLNLTEIPCDPDFADTAAFNEKYGFSADQGANTILVASRKTDPTRYAACIVLPSTRLDVNKKVTELLGVKRASFADGETTVQLTGMQIGGVVAIGLGEYPIFIDSAVMQKPEVVMGGGNRTSKVLIDPKELLKLPNVTAVDQLAQRPSAAE